MLMVVCICLDNRHEFFNKKLRLNQYRINFMSEIGSKVKKIVADHLGVEVEKVVDEASFIDDLGADSLDTVELVMAFEEEFGSEISDSEAEKILTVGDAIKFIESKSS